MIISYLLGIMLINEFRIRKSVTFCMYFCIFFLYSIMADKSLTVNKNPGHTCETTGLGHNHSKDSNYTSQMAGESLPGANQHFQICIVHCSDAVVVVSFPTAGNKSLFGK